MAEVDEHHIIVWLAPKRDIYAPARIHIALHETLQLQRLLLHQGRATPAEQVRLLARIRRKVIQLNLGKIAENRLGIDNLAGLGCSDSAIARSKDQLIA